MVQQHEDALARIVRESAKCIASNHRSNLDSANHVRQSREAIERSLDLLRATSVKP